MATKSNIARPDWDLYSHIATIELWKAVALSLDISPESLDGYGGFNPDQPGHPGDFLRRLAIVCNRSDEIGVVRGMMDRYTAVFCLSVELKYFSEFAKSLMPAWSLPSEFPGFVVTHILADCDVHLEVLDDTPMAVDSRHHAVKPLSQQEEAGLSKREKQIRAIISLAEAKGYAVLSIVTGHKTLLRNECKTLRPDLFGAGNSPFDAAWKAANESDPPRLRMANHNVFAGE